MARYGIDKCEFSRLNAYLSVDRFKALSNAISGFYVFRVNVTIFL